MHNYYYYHYAWSSVLNCDKNLSFDNKLQISYGINQYFKSSEMHAEYSIAAIIIINIIIIIRNWLRRQRNVLKMHSNSISFQICMKKNH